MGLSGKWKEGILFFNIFGFVMDTMATEETETVQPFPIPVCKLQEGDDHGP